MTDTIHLFGDFYYRKTTTSVIGFWLGVAGLLIPPVGGAILAFVLGYYVTIRPDDES